MDRGSLQFHASITTSARSLRRYAADHDAKPRGSFMMKQNRHHERMTIRGHLQPASFVPWIMRHAAKLGLVHHITHASSDRIELDIGGAAELIDMMEMGCSLGPIDVWVETIDRAPASKKHMALRVVTGRLHLI
ncbi:hypothetical protein [Mesorhizobium sp. M1396]|uniref:hypothetical protein n=1 Tax=Mesorhizobium sp. M1396 TaxID=2957095 RepID=UPI00333DB2CA